MKENGMPSFFSLAEDVDLTVGLTADWEPAVAETKLLESDNQAVLL